MTTDKEYLNEFIFVINEYGKGNSRKMTKNAKEYKKKIIEHVKLFFKNEGEVI